MKALILSEIEISYMIDLMKRHQGEEKVEELCSCKIKQEPKTFSIHQKLKYYEQAKATLNILLADLGIADIYSKIILSYEHKMKKRETQVEHVILRLLYRCQLAYWSINRLKKIFDMIKVA